MRAVKAVLGGVMLGSVLLGANAAAGASAPRMGGAIQLWVTPSPNGTGSGGQIVITGAIGDYGTTLSVNAAGTHIPTKSNYKRLVLKHGTVVLNLTQFAKAERNANPTMYNKSTCSAYFIISAPATISSGTGAYTGIAGKVLFHADNAAVLPKTKRGTCNENVNPVADYLGVSGTGTVTFS